jgi:hypothetical protein
MTATDMDCIYTKNTNLIEKKMDNELIILLSAKQIKPAEELYALNESAILVWDKIDGKNNITAIAAYISALYEIDFTIALEDITILLIDMENHQIIHKIHS